MGLIYEEYYKETLDSNGDVVSIDFNYGENFNYAYDVLDKIAEKTPDKVGLIHKSLNGEIRKFTFDDIKRQSIKIANMFVADGIGRGDAVMLIMKRRYEIWPVFMALHRVGAIVIPTSHMVTGDDISDRLTRSEAKAIITVNDDHVNASVKDAFEKGGHTGIKLYCVGDRQDGYKHITEDSKDFPDTMERIETLATDYMFYYFTSGSTGFPKCVIHNYSYPLAHIVTAKNWHGVKPDGVHLTVADSGWAKFVWGKMYGQWLMETAILCYDYEKFYANEMLKLLAEQKVTSFCAPPTIYKYLIREDFPSYDLSNLKTATSAGEHLPEPVAEKFKEFTGIEIREGFGQTETVLQVYTPVGKKQVPSSIGKKSPLLNFKVLDDDLNEVPNGETGELCIVPEDGNKFPVGLFVDYLNDKEEFDAVWDGGVYHTHDRVYQNEEGYFFFVSRSDDVIKSSGYRVGPSEVEDVLLDHDAVKECAVTGYPSPTRGEVIKATIILSEGYEANGDTKRMLQDFVKSKTSLYKYPRVIEFVTELPHTSSGKILRRVIRENDYKAYNEKNNK